MKHEEAVADVVGSGLLIGITVFTFVGLSVLVSTLDAPDSMTNADLGLELDPGDGGWGTGDERVLVHHRGGEPLAMDHTRIILVIDGNVEAYDASTLGGPFADGAFVVGESWQAARHLGSTALVEVMVTNTISDETLVSTMRVQLG